MPLPVLFERIADFSQSSLSGEGIEVETETPKLFERHMLEHMPRVLQAPHPALIGFAPVSARA